jgi:hypothetical protein
MGALLAGDGIGTTLFFILNPAARRVNPKAARAGIGLDPVIVTNAD